MLSAPSGQALITDGGHRPRFIRAQSRRSVFSNGVTDSWLSPRRSVNVSRRRRGVRGRLPRCGRSLRAAARARRVAALSGRLAATVALQRRHHAKLAG
jgi:hypothetical protein